MRRDRGRGRVGRRARAVVGRVVAGRPPRALRRCRPRGRIASPPRARGAGRSGGARVGGRAARAPSSASPSRRAQGSSARFSSESRPRRRSRGRGGCRSSPSITSRGTSRRSTSSPNPLEPAVHVPPRERRAHAPARRARARALGAARYDARRRGGRGVRQGRPTPWARLSGRRRDRSARAGRRSRGVRLPGRARAGARFLLLGAQDVAPVHGARPRARRDRAPCGRPRGVVPARDRARARAAAARGGRRRSGLERIAVVGGVAANSELRAALPDATFAPLELCTDNAAMIASCARFVEARFRTLATLRSMRTRRSRSAVHWRQRRCRAGAPPRRRPVARAQEEPSTSIDEAGWQGVLGVRAAVSTAQRYVVLLKPPSLAARVRAAGGEATEKAQMAAWTAAAVAQQEQFLARLAAVGARIAPEYRYTRVVNGFSARLDPTSLSLLDRDREVTGVFPVRIAYPAQTTDEDGVLPAAVVGPGGRRSRRHRSDRRAPRHGRRPVASVPPWTACSRVSTCSIPGAEGSHSRIRRFRGARSVTQRSSRGSSPGTEGPGGFTASRRERRSSPSASEAGRRTPRAATACTRAPTRSWPGSRRQSIRTTTATRTTPRASR